MMTMGPQFGRAPMLVAANLNRGDNIRYDALLSRGRLSDDIRPFEKERQCTPLDLIRRTNPTMPSSSARPAGAAN